MTILSETLPLMRSRTGILALISTSLLFLLLFLTNRPTSTLSPSALLTSPSDRLHASKITNSTLGFGAIYVLNMPQRTDHRDAMLLAGAASGIDFTFSEGIDGSTVSPKVLPPEYQRINDAQIGSWRAHLNAIRSVIELNLSSALICEDDIDWDVRLKEQLVAYGAASRKLSGGTIEASLARKAHISPYGLDWDLLWPGHCGVQVPVNTDDYVPPAKELLPHDATAVHYSYRPNIDWFFSKTNPSDPHLRAVHHAKEATCTYCYAVSLAGARKILLAIGLEKLMQPFDGQLSEWCNKGWENKCVSVTPSYFTTHRPKGSDRWDSDINGEKGEGDVGIREKGVSEGIRWSVRLNLDGLLKGGSEWEDSYPDP